MVKACAAVAAFVGRPNFAGPAACGPSTQRRGFAPELAADGDAARERFGWTLDGGLVGLAGDFHNGSAVSGLHGGLAAEQGGHG